MRTIKFTIRALVTKEIHVDITDDMDVFDAERIAHEEFNVLNDGTEEDYQQVTISWEEI